MPNEPQQKKFDFPRAEQLGMLRTAVLKPGRAHDGRAVSAALQAFVLRVIDDHGRGKESWPKQETIAREARVSVRQVKAAIEVLHSASLLIVNRRKTPKGGSCNYYRIVWSELALLREPERHKTAATQSDILADQSDILADQSDTVSPPREVLMKVKEEYPPPPPSALAPPARDEGWEAAAEVLLQTGLAEATSVASEARRRRLPPSSVAALAGVYLVHRDRWRGPGALAWRIREFREGQDPADLGLWPPIDPAAEKRARDAAAATHNATRSAQLDDDALRAKVERAADQARETRFGSILDALDAAALGELAARCLTPATLSSPFCARELANPPPRSAFLRGELLRQIEAEAK